MNPSAWSNPPPPGIDMDEESKHSTISSKSITGSILDQIDPFIKNPEYIKYKSSLSRERNHHKRSHSRSNERNRSRSRERRRKRRSRSRGRRRRSRSRSRGRRRRYSHSASRSRSSSYERRHKHKKRRSRRYSRSRSRSRSNKYKSEKKHSRRSRTRSRSPSELNDSFVENSDNRGDDDEPEVCKENAFKNDGSFLEMFKKMQEEKEKEEAAKAAAASTSEEIKKPLPTFGKRRGGRVLKTGMVEKTKAQEEDDLANAQDPWSIYLKEVKKYKEACCDDDSKTRPLVK